MLHHHDSRTQYPDATSDARLARNKLQSLIDRGRARAAHVIAEVQRSQPVDRLARAGSLQFDASNGLALAIGDHRERLHRNGLQQAAERVGVPRAYVAHLLEPERRAWGQQLIADVLTTSFRSTFESEDERVLLRSVDGEVRAVLSDRYRRLDSPVVVDAFAKAAQDVGAVPIEGYALDTRIAVKAVLPVVLEPVPNEVMVLGVVLETSDFGVAALTVRSFMLRLVCSNGLILDSALRQVHLGRKLSDGPAFSDRTYRLDTATTASAIGDIVRAQLAPTRIGELQSAIRRANETEVAPMQVDAFLRKQMSRAEAQSVKDAFSSADVVNMPPGQTSWRLAQAIAWVAGRTEDETRRLDLMRTAGEALAA